MRTIYEPKNPSKPKEWVVLNKILEKPCWKNTYKFHTNWRGSGGRRRGWGEGEGELKLGGIGAASIEKANSNQRVKRAT